MKHNASLIRALLEKWEETAHRSPWWQSFPQGLNCADLCKLDIQEEEAASRWVQLLISGQDLKTEISADSSAVQKLRHLYFENRNRERLQGGRQLAIGYPFLLIQNPDNAFIPFTIPLFIWKVNLEPSPNRMDSWTLQQDASMPVRLNPYFLNYLEDKQLELPSRELISKMRSRSWKARDLISWIEQVAEAADYEYEYIDKGVRTFPSQRQAQILGERGAVIWSGVLSLFPTDTLNTYRRLRHSLQEAEQEEEMQGEEVPEEAVEKLPPTTHPFGRFSTTPGQQAALEASRRHDLSLVFGPSGSGKTHGLTNVVTNALSNGLRCLVLSGEVNSLQQIHTLLLENGIENQSFLFKDHATDKPLLLEILRRAAERVKNTSPFPEEEFKGRLKKTLRMAQRLEQEFEAVNSSIFGNLTWTETVGIFLRSNQLEGKELLSSQLNPKDFVFTFSEYQLLQEGISSSKDLYPNVNTLKHPLCELHEEVFLEKDTREAREFLEAQIEQFLKKAGQLQYRYISKLDGYAEKLTIHYENYYWELRNQLRDIQENIEDYKNKYGADFEDSGVVTTGKLHVYGVFSNKHKNILQAKDTIAQKYQQLQRLYHQQEYFDYRFADTGDVRNIRRITQNLEDFEKTLDHWYRRIPQSVQEDLQRLNSKNTHSGLDYQGQLEELEYSLGVLIEEINNAHLYHQPLNNNMLTLNKRKQQLEEIIEKLEYTRFHLRDFATFHPWHANWLQLGELSKKLIRALIKVKPDNWMAAFESWYFHNRLTLGYLSDIPQSEAPLLEFQEQVRELQESLPAQIRHKWHKRLSTSLKGLKRSNRSSYQKLFGKNSRDQSAQIPLPELMPAGAQAITDAIPAFLCTTEQASALFLQQKEPLFDLVIIDECSHLSVEQCLPLLWLGERAILFGNTLHSLRQARETILEFASQTGSKQIALHEIVYPFPESLFHFQRHFLHAYNTSFFPLSIPPIPALAELVAVEGRYDEQEGTNEAEAREVLQLLNSIEKTPQQTYPRVTIACATIQQRDLIADYLLKNKQQRAEGSEKIRQLERNGLMVVHFDELPGLHSDIRIVSLTYGSVNLRGKLTEDIYTLDVPEHETCVKLAFSQNCRQLLFLNSIPEADLEKLSGGPDSSNTALVSLLLRYLKAQKEGDARSADKLFEESEHLQTLTEPETHTSLFAEEVAKALQPYLGPGRLHLQQTDGPLHIPLLVTPVQEGAPRIAILPDGFISSSFPVALQWEQHLRRELKKRHYEYLTTWSVNWWRDPRQEARKLASLIIRLDSQFAEAPSEPSSAAEEDAAS